MSDEYASEDIDKVNVTSKLKKIDKKYGKVGNIETKIRDPFIPPSVEQKIRETAVKSRGFTSMELAQKHDVRISAVKKLLKQMVNENLIKIVESSRRLIVYKGIQTKGN